MFRYACVVFTLAVAVLTGTHHLWVYLISLCLLVYFTVIWLYLAQEHKKMILSYLSVSVCVFFLVRGVVSIGLSQKKHSDDNEKEQFVEKSSLVVTGTLIWWLKNNDYVLETSQWDVLVRGLDQSVTYGDYLMISWYVRAVAWWPKKPFLSTLSIPLFFVGEFDYPLWLWVRWYQADIWAKAVITTEHIGRIGYVDSRKAKESIFSSKLLQVKRTLRSRLQDRYITRSHQALLWGLLYGDISLMKKDLYDWFIKSNLAHLVAVSGWNLIMLAWLLSLVLFFLPVYIRYLCILFSLIAYAVLVWMEWSVFRALLMWSLGIVAIFFWRTPYVWRLLMISWIIILCFRPYSLWYDVWFLLSFGALVWIVGFLDVMKILTPKLMEKSGDVGWLVLANLWATLWVAPVLIFFMWKISLLWVFANMVVLPIIPLVTIVWWLSLLLWWAIWSNLVSLTSAFLEYIYTVSAFFSWRWGILEIDSLLWRYVLSVGLVVLYVGIYMWIQFLSKKKSPNE